MEWRNTITNGIDSNGDEDEPIESNSTGGDPEVDGSRPEDGGVPTAPEYRSSCVAQPPGGEWRVEEGGEEKWEQKFLLPMVVARY